MENAKNYFRNPINVMNSIEKHGGGRAKHLMRVVNDEIENLEDIYQRIKNKIMDKKQVSSFDDILLEVALRYIIPTLNYKNEVDFREQEVLDLIGDDWEIVPLAVGDFRIDNGKILIERKGTDLWESVISGKMFQQLEEIHKNGEFGFLFINRSLSDIMKENSMRGRSDAWVFGTIASLCIRGFPPVFLENKAYLSATINAIAVKNTDGKERSAMNLIRNKSRSKKNRQTFILTSFPNIGPKTADKMFVRYKTLNNIFNIVINKNYDELLTMDYGKKLIVIKKIVDGEINE